MVAKVDGIPSDSEENYAEIDPKILKKLKADEAIDKKVDAIKPLAKIGIGVAAPQAIDKCATGLKAIAPILSPPGYQPAAEIIITGCAEAGKVASRACAGPAVDCCLDNTAKVAKKTTHVAIDSCFKSSGAKDKADITDIKD